MTAISLEMYDALRAIDVPDPKARAVARAVEADLNEQVRALNAKIDGLRDDMTAGLAALRKELGADIAGVRKDLAGEVASARKDLGAEIAAMRREVDALRSDFATTRWVANAAFAVLVAIALKLFLA